MPVNGASGYVTTAGTFYAPTYSATAFASASFSNTPTKAAIVILYKAATTLNTPLIAHQRVSVTAQPGSSFYFTLTDYADVTVTAHGNAGGVFRLFSQSGSGVVLGPLYGTGTLITDSSLPPGDYRIDSSLVWNAVQDTQSNTAINPGKTVTAYSFTVTITPGSADGGGN